MLQKPSVQLASFFFSSWVPWVGFALPFKAFMVWPIRVLIATF